MSSKWDDLNLTEQCKAVREMGDRISQYGVQPDMEVAQRLCEIGLTPSSGEIERFKSGVVNLDQLNEAAKRIASTHPSSSTPSHHRFPAKHQGCDTDGERIQFDQSSHPSHLALLHRLREPLQLRRNPL